MFKSKIKTDCGEFLGHSNIWTAKVIKNISNYRYLSQRSSLYLFAEDVFSIRHILRKVFLHYTY